MSFFIYFFIDADTLPSCNDLTRGEGWNIFQSVPSVRNIHSERVSAIDRYNTSRDTVQVLLLVKDTPSSKESAPN